MIKCEDIRPGDVIYSDEGPRRSILVVAIRPFDPPRRNSWNKDWNWEVWWLDRTSLSGRWKVGNSRTSAAGISIPIGPWRCDDEIPWHYSKRSERHVHHEDGDPEGD